MDYFEAEEKQNHLLKLFSKEKSPRLLLTDLINYFDILIDSIATNLIEPFMIDLLPHFETLIKKYSPFSVDPSDTERLLEVLKKVLSQPVFNKYLSNMDKELNRINDELHQLKKSLDGQSITMQNTGEYLFPVIVKSNDKSNLDSLIDSLKISLLRERKNKSCEFILFPSAVDIEKRLAQQIKTSWEYARKYVEITFKKKLQHYKVIITLDKSFAVYEGGSLGIAITIAFIDALLKEIKSRESIRFKSSIISTGQVDNDGNVSEMSREIIESKLNSVFYSTARYFIIPKGNEYVAENYLLKLSEKYPKRNLEIIGVKNIKDIFNRRDLIDQKKTNIAIWSAKKVLTNKLSTLLLILLIISAVSFYFWNYDDNPMGIEYTGNEILIKNKYDKILWHLPLIISDKTLESEGFAFNNSRIIDIDNDQVNEVLISYYSDNLHLTLFNNKGETIWEYVHIDSIESRTEKFIGTFTVKGIVDTLHRGDITELIVYFQHHNYFPSGIVKLNLKTGEEISDILWHPGGIGSAILLDWNGDGTKEIIAGGASNGMHSAFAFSIDENKLLGTFPTSNNYYFKDFELADFNHYIIIRQTDYGKYFFPKYSAVTGVGLYKKLNYISLSVGEGKARLSEANFMYTIRVDENFKFVELVVSDEYVVERDRKIEEGILTLPLTDTPEFRNSILNNIFYWDGKKFEPSIVN